MEVQAYKARLTESLHDKLATLINLELMYAESTDKFLNVNLSNT